MNIYLEIFGYIGTALVIISMMMTSLVKLRIFNMCGGLISLIYSVLICAWPVVVLNACLICINFVQTVRQLNKREDVTLLSVKDNDATLQYLLGIWKADFEKCNPDLACKATQGENAHILYEGQEAVGFLIGAHRGETPSADILYLVPSRRTATMKARALEMLAKQI